MGTKVLINFSSNPVPVAGIERHQDCMGSTRTVCLVHRFGPLDSVHSSIAFPPSVAAVHL